MQLTTERLVRQYFRRVGGSEIELSSGDIGDANTLESDALMDRLASVYSRFNAFDDASFTAGTSEPPPGMVKRLATELVFCNLAETKGLRGMEGSPVDTFAIRDRVEAEIGRMLRWPDRFLRPVPKSDWSVDWSLSVGGSSATELPDYMGLIVTSGVFTEASGLEIPNLILTGARIVTPSTHAVARHGLDFAIYFSAERGRWIFQSSDEDLKGSTTMRLSIPWNYLRVTATPAVETTAVLKGTY